MKKDKKQSKDKKDLCNIPQRGKITRSWGLATRFENRKIVKTKKKKEK